MTLAQLKRRVFDSQRGLPPLQTWLTAVADIDPALATAVEGIYCGQAGELREEIPGTNRFLVMTWYNGKVETAYVS